MSTSTIRRPLPSTRSETVDSAQLLDALVGLEKGNFSVRLPSDWTGVAGKVADTFNRVAELNQTLAAELERMRVVVGEQGRLGHRAALGHLPGSWGGAVGSVNLLVDSLTHPTTETARVIGAVAQGDLSQTMALEFEDRPLQGEFLRTARLVNKMVTQLGTFASEVTRVAREVGTEGKLGGQAKVKGVAGTWKDLTDSVNSMAGNLTAQVRNIADVSKAIAAGDLSRKITVDVKGEILELKDTVNTMVDQLNSFASEVTRVAREVGTDGKLGGQADVRGVAGTWKDLTDSVNSMAGNLTSQVRNIADVSKAIATGDLSRKITVDVKGEILELKITINTMVDQLNSFASEVTRVAREVGTEGKLGGQADVRGVSGTWKDLTDSVNFMAGNLTGQVRGIAKVVTAVANGDLKRKLVLEAKGEIAELAGTINEMIDTLATFAEQVTTMAREVGIEGRLGGQARVPGASGTWKDLTDNVNQLAANLTTQVRSIADVATSVTNGDLTRSIALDAQGEMAALKDYINEMIRNLRETTEKNTEQDWLKTNLAKFSRMLQGQRDLMAVGRLILSELVPVVRAHQAVFYILDKSNEDEPMLGLLASYADRTAGVGRRLQMGEGLLGQCAIEKRKIHITNPPPDYVRISSELGSATPRSIIVLPVVFEGEVKGVLELASFERFSSTHEAFLDQLTESIGIVINTIEANMRTEDLLKQSQSLAGELSARGEELQKTNEELQEKARLLAHQNEEVERKNREVELARQALEEKAKQLALTSKYKSEFLANMSHELRTPLNSLLILSDQLGKNADGNLSNRQIEFAKTIHSSGNDLLVLINDILDLSKIESGTVIVDPGELHMKELHGYVERTFRSVAESKGIDFLIQMAPDLPSRMYTDAKRLQQVLKNLLSNAFKFTHQGGVSLTVTRAQAGWSPDNEELNRSPSVLAFWVKDTGIGVAPDKQHIIFEAFQQADASTSRKYGGTGLGLAISRELSRLLGGEIRITSSLGQGSTFTLYLPESYSPPHLPSKPMQLEPASAEAAPGNGNGNGGRPLVEDLESAPAVLIEEVAPAVDLDELGDDRHAIEPGDRVVLIVENDLAFARVLLETARERGLKALVSSLGTSALSLARDYLPDAITLDIFLPDIEGWRVLARLKNDLSTRHIPVAVISTEESRDLALAEGAIAFVPKPIQSKETLEAVLDQLRAFQERKTKHLVVVESDPQRRGELAAYLADDFVQVTAVADAGAALQAIEARHADCVVATSESLPLERVFAGTSADAPVARRVPQVVIGPVIPRDEGRWKRWRDRGTVRRVQSPERLLDEVSFFLHRNLDHMPPDKRQVLETLHQSNATLEGKKVLIVDDDVRNIFALSALLEEHQMEIVSAISGEEALGILRERSDIDIILMDVMMPGMDGIQLMGEVRKISGMGGVPIIAVTAKAMKGDRERCIEAGAWDYLSKPVYPEQMLAVLRAWLHR